MVRTDRCGLARIVRGTRRGGRTHGGPFAGSMTSSSKMISVVIATKDRASYLERAFDSLERQLDAPAFEVVVVDNGSTDRTAQVARAAANRLAVTYVHEPEPNRGAARNRGVARATGDVVAFIDDDVWLPQRFLAAHAAAHASGPSLAVTGPIINVPSYDVTPKPTAANYSRA